jgi:hypothetical protein
MTTGKKCSPKLLLDRTLGKVTLFCSLAPPGHPHKSCNRYNAYNAQKLRFLANLNLSTYQSSRLLLHETSHQSTC